MKSWRNLGCGKLSYKDFEISKRCAWVQNELWRSGGLCVEHCESLLWSRVPKWSTVYSLFLTTAPEGTWWSSGYEVLFSRCHHCTPWCSSKAAGPTEPLPPARVVCHSSRALAYTLPLQSGVCMCVCYLRLFFHAKPYCLFVGLQCGWYRRICLSKNMMSFLFCIM